MRHDDGAEDSQLAPVIDLFGGRRARAQVAASSSPTPPADPAPPVADRSEERLAEVRAAAEEIIAASRRRNAPEPSPSVPGGDAAPVDDGAGWFVEDGTDPDTPAFPRISQAAAAARSRWAVADPAIGAGSGDIRSDDSPSVDSGPRLSIEEASTRALARRGLSVSEMRDKLSSIGYPADAIETEIERLLGARYLDDARLAEEIVRVEFERKGKGRSVVTGELRRRGISPDDYLGALDDIDTELELERAAEIAYRKMSSSSDLDARTAERRLSALLARRGFSGDLVRAAVARATERLAGGN
ncbi:regulatory protein RecX [Amnibacterium flavum]|uniref:Regulatory protein RecX n=1 Tax=Amnibacterium flavum TaxID=2173173 RepID=A0A2V1HLW2_9MICO|nr:regulatory protein RecX [Amnibacterium flavum]PVZ93518.1 hypothetical protein DDQ50_14450 [Amnibacterium flavum]